MDFKGEWKKEGVMGRGSGRKRGEGERQRVGGERKKINHFYDFGKYS